MTGEATLSEPESVELLLGGKLSDENSVRIRKAVYKTIQTDDRCLPSQIQEQDERSRHHEACH